MTSWTHLWTVTHEDDSNYVAGKSNNGGCYSESTHEHYFISDELRIKKLVTYTTSAEFSYDELHGSYRNSNMAELYITNIKGDWDRIHTQTVDGYDENILLDDIAFDSSFNEALNARDSYIPPRDEEEIESAEQIMLRGNLSEKEINNRIFKLKSFLYDE